MLMIAFASITQLKKSLTRLTSCLDEGWIDRGPRYLSWSQGQANENEQWCNSMGNQPKQICNQAINNYEKSIQENMPEHKNSCRASNPFPTDYDNDLDTTAELNEQQPTYYQSQIGILHWIVEFGED